MESPTTYGIIGVGLMGVEHIRNLIAIPQAAITCLADNHPHSLSTALEILSKEHPSTFETIRTFTNAIELFQANLCQIAIIATPNHTHHEILLQAFSHADPNLHLLVEKPLCTTIAHCRDVVQGAAKRPGLTYVGLEYAYMPPVAKVIREAKEGVIGRVWMVSIREHRFPFLRKVRDWNRFNCNSGGTFVEKCCHFFDLFCRILHPQTPVSVLASASQDVNHLDEIYDGKRSDIWDNGFVIVNFSHGARACLDLCMFAEASKSQEEVCIVGDKGKLEAFLPQMEVRRGIRGEHAVGQVVNEVVRDERVKYEGHHHGSSYLEHLDFLKVVGGGAGGNSGVWQGVMSVAVGVAAQISVREERMVRMEEILNRDEIVMSIDGLN